MADAVLYKEADTQTYYAVNNTPSAAALTNGNTSYGTLLVNVTNKSVEEIIRILEARVYSPIALIKLSYKYEAYVLQYP